MKLTGAAILVSRGMKVLEAAPAAYPYRSAVEHFGMELAWFITAFDSAAAFCREFAQQDVIESLPPSLRFNFRAAHRKPEPDGRVKFLGGRMLAPAQLLGVEPVRARRYLWVDGKVPQWINLSVHATDSDHTYIDVCVTDRLVAELEHMYHQQEGNPPFHVLGPPLPPWWVSPAASGKFSLNWRAAEQRNAEPGAAADGGRVTGSS